MVNGLKTKVTPEDVDDIPVLGVVGKGASKSGKSSPWILTSATEAQRTAAAEYMGSL